MPRDIQLAPCSSAVSQQFWFEAQPVVIATKQSYLKIHPRSNSAKCVAQSLPTGPILFFDCSAIVNQDWLFYP